MSDIVIPESGFLVTQQASFEDLLSQATVIDSPAVEKQKNRLVGVPHIITKVSYRPGLLDGNKVRQDYCTVEAVAAPQAMLDEAISRGWIPPDNIGLIPNAGERLVYQADRTGIRRQVTQILWNKGLIQFPDQPQDMAYFDMRFQDWAAFAQAGEMNDGEGGKFPVPEFDKNSDGTPLAIFPRHGLRASYMEEHDATIFYLS